MKQSRSEKFFLNAPKVLDTIAQGNALGGKTQGILSPERAG
jgi:hypothetical protein